jgi:hypothetical protein
MGRADPTPDRPIPDTPGVRYLDAEGRPTTDPAAVVRSEIVESEDHGRPRRTRFFLAERDLGWLPVGEPTFLIWVLAALMLVWLAIGLVLQLP